MIEVRQVREDEMEAMLGVMAAAYDDYTDGWAEGFYHGPYNDPKWKRVVVVDGKVVSCLVYIPASIYLGGATVTMGGIAGVATLPDERRHGYAGMLMRDSMHALRELGYFTSALYPFSFKYYRKFGWELAAQKLILDVRPEMLPDAAELSRVRAFEESDLRDVMRIYDDHHRMRHGPFVRDEYHWRRHILPRANDALVFDDNGITGYMLATTGEHEGEPVFRIHEMVALTDAARRGLVAYAASQPARILYSSSRTELDTLGLLSPRAQWDEGHDSRCRITVVPSFQFRIIDLREAVKALMGREVGLDIDLSVLMEDELAEWNEEYVTVRDDQSIPRKSEHWIRADVRTMSQVYIGYYSPSEAYSMGLMDASGSQALDFADRLFPKSEPEILSLNEF